MPLPTRLHVDLEGLLNVGHPPAFNASMKVDQSASPTLDNFDSARFPWGDIEYKEMLEKLDDFWDCYGVKRHRDDR